MINRMLNDIDTTVSIISKSDYEKIIADKKVQIKGKSSYEDKWLLEDLPRYKEFYVLEDFYQSYPDGSDEWAFSIATTYKGMYFIISCAGGN